MTTIKELLPFCGCGCGERVARKGNRFINGHSGGRIKRNPPKPQLCECGCGGYALSGNRFINGHNQKGISNAGINHPMHGKHHTEETKQVLSNQKLGNKNPMYGKIYSKEELKKNSDAVKNWHREHPGSVAGINHPMYGKHHTKESKIASRKSNLEANKCIQHHYIYDDSDKLKYTVGMTRSEHTSLHRLLKKLGYIIPHINTEI